MHSPLSHYAASWYRSISFPGFTVSSQKTNKQIKNPQRRSRFNKAPAKVSLERSTGCCLPTVDAADLFQRAGVTQHPFKVVISKPLSTTHLLPPGAHRSHNPGNGKGSLQVGGMTSHGQRNPSPRTGNLKSREHQTRSPAT